MLLFGLSDSPVSAAGAVEACPDCSGAAHIDGGACVSCLLRSGLDSGPSSSATPSSRAQPRACPERGEAESNVDPEEVTKDLTNENWYDLLTQINIHDSDWRLGNYQILDELGRGGMGVIYRARQRHSRRIVALKRVLSYHSESRETLQRFRREAEAAANLDHPNILPIYEVGEADDLPFFTMKFATGGSLQQAAPVLRENPRECVRLVMKITRAVAYAHGEGILHRDLKPGNILLDARGEPLVSDFGLAKWLDGTSDLTRTLTIFGTPGYIAPEQAHSAARELTPAADIYSIGAILFDLLTGRPPFLGEHALAVIKQADEKPAPKLRSLVKHASRDLETICAKCLEREPNLRYRSATDLAEDLQRWLEGRPIIARHVVPPVKLWRWSKRNPLLSGISIVALVSISIALARYFEARALLDTARDRDLQEHSIGVEPFLDLDRARLDSMFAAQLEQGATAAFRPLGPVRVETQLRPTKDEASAATLPSKPRTHLVGSIRRDGNETRISLRLVGSEEGETLFQKTLNLAPYEPPGELLPKIALSVYNILATEDWSQIKDAQTDPAARVPDARDFLSSGRQLLKGRTANALQRAAECFRKAESAEPRSALSAAFLAHADIGLSQIQSEPRLLHEAELAAQRSLRLNPQLGEAHRALASVFFAQGNYVQAQEQLFESIEDDGLMPAVAARLAGIMRALGHPVDALRWCRLASSPDQPADIDNLIGDCWADLGDDIRAEAAYDRVTKFRPELPDGLMGVCRLRLLERRFSEAQSLCVQELGRYGEYGLVAQLTAQVQFFSRNHSVAKKLYSTLAENEPDGGSGCYGGVTYSSVLGKLVRLDGEQDKGRRLLTASLAREQSLLSSAPTCAEILYRMAAIEASLDQKTESLDHLRAAVDNGWVDYRSTLLDPRFDAVAQTPEFQKIVSDVTMHIKQMRSAAVAEFRSP